MMIVSIVDFYLFSSTSHVMRMKFYVKDFSGTFKHRILIFCKL